MLKGCTKAVSFKALDAMLAVDESTKSKIILLKKNGMSISI